MRGWSEFHPRMDSVPPPHGLRSIPAWNGAHRRPTNNDKAHSNSQKGLE